MFARRNARAVHDGFYSRAVAPRRNYADVTDAIREFMRRGVIIKTVINGLTFDGATKDFSDTRRVMPDRAEND